LGLLGADIGAWDVSALRVRVAAIVMVVAVSAGLAWVNPCRGQVLLGADPDRALGRKAPACPDLAAGLAHPAGKQRSTTRSPPAV
jgi:hypothetical protein